MQTEVRSSDETLVTGVETLWNLGLGAALIAIGIFKNKNLQGFIKAFVVFIVLLIQRIVLEIIATEQMFLMMTNLYAFMCQFFFFTLCDIAFLKAEYKHRSGKVISGLTTLLLYSIFTYFASKIKDTFQHTFERSHQNTINTRDYIFRIVKVILEFAKAAIVILCLKEQGLHYHFDPIYSTFTFVYYLATEKLFVDAAVHLAKFIKVSWMEYLEHLYVPIFLHLVSLTLTFGVMMYLTSIWKYTTYTIVSCYFTCYLPVKDLVWNYVNPLLLERRTYASFKVANEKDISQWDDICAVCLERMSRARITPCNHLFHPQCLKRCLQSSMQCPLCKRDFIREYNS